MKKLAIILDSFSSKSKKEIEKTKDVYFLPLKLIIDDKEYLDGVDLSNEALSKLASEAKDLKTSQPSPAMMEDLFTKLSKEYENVIYLCIGRCLSGTHDAAQTLSKDIKNLHVINNFLVGDAFQELANYLLRNKDQDINELIKFADEYGSQMGTLIIPENNEAFIKSGRLSKALAFFLEKLSVVPIISYDNLEKLGKKGVRRSGLKAALYAVEKIEKALKLKKPEKKKWIWLITSSINNKLANKVFGILKDKKYTAKIIDASTLITAHTGQGAFSIGTYQKLD